jgi:predicted transglutaminase-like cysteine proteinase
MKSLSSRATRAAATASFVLGLLLIANQDDAKDFIAPVLFAAPPPTSAGPTAMQRRGVAALRFQSDGGVGRATTAPVGFINFEMRYPAEVQDSAPAFATTAQIEVANGANKSVDDQITWRDTRLWTVELNGPAYGDCKSFALTKRHMLRELGVPDGAVRIVIVSAAGYRQLHMVVEMQTADDVFVLDSMPNASGNYFYRAAAMPASYSIIEYGTWGKPDQWIAPS